jgi:hypothetical protein
MTSTDDLLNVFHQWHMVEISVPTLQNEAVQCDGVARMTGPSHLEVQIFPSNWPIPGLDPRKSWHLLCDQGLHFFNIIAHPEKLEHPRQIRLRIESHETRDHQRQNLRVDTDIYMAYWKGEIAQTDRPQPVRTHASLSSQGLSFTTDANFSRGDLLSLHLILPGTTLESLQCKAHVLSVGQETKKGRKTALKIVHIMPEDSEKFSLFILAEHFRSMQAKTRLMALMLGNW